MFKRELSVTHTQHLINLCTNRENACLVHTSLSVLLLFVFYSSLVVFLIGFPLYKRIPPQGNVVVSFCGCIFVRTGSIIPVKYYRLHITYTYTTTLQVFC